MAEALRGGDSVLAGLDERALTAMFQVSVNNDRLMHRFRPGCFDGDLTLFVATADRGEHPAELAGRSDHLTGALHVHRIPCQHNEMTSPEALREIGRRIGTLLEGMQG